MASAEQTTRTDPRVPRTGARRLRWAASGTLAGVMAGHLLLETARDALFLANVSVERLPFVTIAIAVLALLAARERGGRGNRGMLLLLQAAAAAGSVGFWVLTAAGQSWSFYVLYVWSGVITSLVVVRFWLTLAELMTIIEAKRVFASIAMGGSIGALAGAAMATLLAPLFGAEGLLLASAAAFGASAIGPMVALRPGEADGEVASPPTEDSVASLATSLREVLGHPYALRVALLVVLGGMTLTFADYLFKSVLTEEVPAEDLASWLSRIYLGLNLFSIAMLAGGVTPLVRSLGVDRSLAVLPALVLLAGLGVLAGGALVATIGLKLADGTLRYSLHKTASELLYLPMPASLRGAVKGAIDIVGQTGAKALASLLILALVAAPQPRMVVAGALVLLAASWCLAALRLRRVYLDVFRSTLQERSVETRVEHPELDIDSVGSLLRALGDPDERRVLAALRLLAERGRVDLVPTLILYHPSPTVVATALDLFAFAGREDLPQMLGRLIDHEEPSVRAAAVRACWAIESEVDTTLEALADTPCLVVRFSAMAGRLAHGNVEPEALVPLIDEAMAYPVPDPRLAVATGARLHYHRVYREALVALAGDPDLEVARESIHAVRESGDPWFTRPLVDLLGQRRIREEVRQALLARGDEALAVLGESLVDPSVPIPVLRHVPRTLARFDRPAAVSVLVGGLSEIESGMVRYKILRSLESLHRSRSRAEPAETRSIGGDDAAQVRREFDRTLARSLELLAQEAALSRGPAGGGRRSIGGELLAELLEDKRVLAVRRLFMMLGLLYPDEDFRVIREGLASRDPSVRSSAQELIETRLSRDVANAILALEMPGHLAARLAVAGRATGVEDASYESALRLLLADGSESVRAVALYHAAELGIDPGLPIDEGAPPAEVRGVQDRALAMLQDLLQTGGRAKLLAGWAR